MKMKFNFTGADALLNVIDVYKTKSFDLLKSNFDYILDTKFNNDFKDEAVGAVRIINS